MNPNSYYYNAQKQNYIPPIKDNQELLMQRNLYFNDNKGQPSQALYSMMPNSNILNSQVYQQSQANLNASQMQNMNIPNQQLPIPQDINPNSKLKYVDSLQRLSSESGPYPGMAGGQPNPSLSQEWLKVNGLNQNVNNSMALGRIQGNQPPGQPMVDPSQKNISARKNDNTRTSNFQNVNLPMQQQQPQPQQLQQLSNRNQKINNPNVPLSIDKRNPYPGDNQLTSTQQNLANSIIKYRKGIMEGTTKPDPSFEKYIKQCYGLLTPQEQMEINKFIQTFQGNPIGTATESPFSTGITQNPNNFLTNNNIPPSNPQQPKLNNEPFNPSTNINNVPPTSAKPKKSLKKLTKHDLNSLKYMIDSREKFDDLFYHRFLPAKYKYFSPLQIMGKNIDYYDIYSLLSFVGFEKIDVCSII